MSRVLYLSYDGMTDPLGQSQVIPYLEQLVSQGHEIDILSFEKPDKFSSFGKNIATLLKDKKIGWHPQIYHKKPPILSTVFDLYRMKLEAARLHRERPYAIAHARSYISALAALSLKQKFGLRFLFDMRGFWADERVDGGMWPQSNPIFALVYRYFKRVERTLLVEADHVVCLTHKASEIMAGWNIPKLEEKLTVIPCCVDYDYFQKEDAASEENLRKKLGIGPNEKMMVYLGSLGTWYMLDEMLRFFRTLLSQDKSYRFCFFTPEPEQMVRDKAGEFGIPQDKIVVTHLQRSEVPLALKLADCAISFIKPSFSKQASSPTKVGEYLACGLPIVANGGVGDMEKLFSHPEAGYLLSDFSEAQRLQAVEKAAKGPQGSADSRKRLAREHFSLSGGSSSHNKIYQRLVKE